VTHAAAVEAAHAQPLSQLPREMPVSKPGPTLAQMQVRVFRILLVWPSIALGVIVGWLVALLVAAAQSGNGVFGLGGAVAVLTFVPNLLALSCFVIGAAMSAVQGRRVRSLARAALAGGPGSGPVATAVLVRIARAAKSVDAHQLLYAAHAEGQRVAPVIVPVPHGFALPQAGSSAWLVLNPKMPAFASYCDTGFDQHEGAGADPALQNLSRVQRGLSVPGRHYWLPVFVTLSATVVSWGLLSLALHLLG